GDDDGGGGHRRLARRRRHHGRAVVAGAQAAQREVVRPEVVDARLEVGERPRDQVEVDVIERTGAGGGAEVDLAARVGLAAEPARREGEEARAVEARGFESLWFPEHTHIPVSRRSPWPGGPTLPKEYWHTHDLFVALATAAAVTTTLKVGSGICLLVERDPITTAKEVASLDFLSRGRVLFGVGGGWNAE